MLAINNLSYTHTNRDLLFDNINLAINHQDKIALIGNNGAGKSTLLQILAGEVRPSSGTITTDSSMYYVPQDVGQLNNFTVAEALHVDVKLKALKEIIDGYVTETNLSLLNDDWLIEERCNHALSKWNLTLSDLSRKMNTLSGGQKTKVLLAGIDVHQHEIILLDEPSNHLDLASRNILYEYIRTTTNTLVVVSHDKTLLNLLDTVYELSSRGIFVYGGNYNFYIKQKKLESDVLIQDVRSKEKELRKAKEVERESLERKNKLDARGKKKQEKAGLPTILLNTFKNNAEKSSSKMKDVHAEKIESITKELNEIRSELPDIDKIKIDLNKTTLHAGKRLIKATNVNFSYHNQELWKEPLNFLVTSGTRLALKGSNGSGKTTLIKILLNQLQPLSGNMERSDFKVIYIDQEYSLINTKFTVYEQVQQFNDGNLQEHELKIRLNRFLFAKTYWDKSCQSLSGGEKMRLLLCCLMISNQTPDLIILDEPTNNLDIQNSEILTNAIREYNGTLVVASHDTYFLQEISIQQEIVLV